MKTPEISKEKPVNKSVLHSYQHNLTLAPNAKSTCAELVIGQESATAFS